MLVKFSYIKCIILFFILSNALNGFSQEKSKKFKYGFNYGIGEQGIFPFHSKDYTYENQFYKLQVNYLIKQKNKYSLELNIEPSIYIAKHQLLNEQFVRPEDGENYLELREQYTQLKTMKEYSLGIGIIYRYQLNHTLSTYVIGSIGPMITDTETERMAKGFAFSDVFSIGFSHMVSSIIFDIRYGIRHVSNLNFSSPNSGYNATNIEVGFLIEL